MVSEALPIQIMEKLWREREQTTTGRHSFILVCKECCQFSLYWRHIKYDVSYIYPSWKGARLGKRNRHKQGGFSQLGHSLQRKVL